MHVSTRCLLALSLAAFVGCGQDTPNEPDAGFVDDRPTTLLRLAFAEQKWQGRGFLHYRYQYQQSCFCAPPATSPLHIHVSNTSVVAAFDFGTGQPVADASQLPTIDGLFARLREAAAGDAIEIRAEYDPVLGFPTRVYIDRSQQIADEEIAWEASAVTPVQR